MLLDLVYNVQLCICTKSFTGKYEESHDVDKRFRYLLRIRDDEINKLSDSAIDSGNSSI